MENNGPMLPKHYSSCILCMLWLASDKDFLHREGEKTSRINFGGWEEGLPYLLISTQYLNWLASQPIKDQAT